MRLDNYLPEMAKRFPNLYILGAEKAIEKIRKIILDQNSIASVSRNLKIPENTLRDFLNSNSLPSLGKLEEIQRFLGINFWDEIFNESQMLCGKTYTNKIKIPKKFTENFAYFAGIMRDGGLSKYKGELVISQKDKEWLERIRSVLEELFEIKARIVGPRRKDGCYYIKFRSVALSALIKTILNYRKHDWDTPEIILKATKEEKKYYIRGFWEAEGSYNVGIHFHQSGNKEASKPLEDIREMLKEFDIESWVRGPYKGVNKPMWRLYIPKRDGIKFLEIFKPKHRKLTRLLSTADSDRRKVA